jgi:hypothetical protein
MRSCVYNLEYSVLDKIGRAKKSTHVGVFASVPAVEEAKAKIMRETKEEVSFNVYVIEDVFTRSL